ncbi:MAG: DNA polymerase III subunit delta' [Paracoccaceae bacterium]
MSDEDLPEPDRIAGAPHPRETAHLIGQRRAEDEFLRVYNAGRLHHAWLISGPRGTGKATLAWGLARFLLAAPAADGGPSLFGDAPPKPDSLHIDPEHPVARRIAARSEPGLFHITRTPSPTTGKMRDQIAVDDVRNLAHFLQLSAADGGRRAVIVDAVDEMNTAASNALLKMLEEPPARTTLLLVAHQPSRLLPTIRSRCRELRLGALSPEDLTTALAQAEIDIGGDTAALAELAGGSVGEAIRLTQSGGLELYGDLVGLFSTLPKMDRSRALRLADSAAQRGSSERLDLLLWLVDLVMARLARSGALGRPPAIEGAKGEAAMLMRLAPNAASARHWAQAAEEIGARARHGRAVNLDPAALILDMFIKIQQTAES